MSIPPLSAMLLYIRQYLDLILCLQQQHNSLFLERLQVILVGGSKQFYHGGLLRREDDTIRVHPPHHAASNEGGHVAEVQFLCRCQRLILTPVAAASCQHEAVPRNFPVPQNNINITAKKEKNNYIHAFIGGPKHP